MSDERPPYHHGNLKQTMHETALAMLNEGGIDTISMRAIAQRIGVSPSAAYRHYENKEALLAGVAQAGFEQITAHLKAVRHDDQVPVNDKFQRMGVVYITFAVANPAQYRLMFGNQAVDTSRFPEVLAARRALSKEVFSMIRLCQGEPAPDRLTMLAIANAAWSLTHGAAMLIIDGSLAVDDVTDFSYGITYWLRTGIDPARGTR
jgi:AcrR family transcriptional regulator